MRFASAAVVAVVAAVAVTSEVAQADGIYVTEAFGGTDVRGELAEHVDNGFRFRIAAGYRAKAIAVEVWGAGILGFGHRNHDSYERARTVDGSTYEGGGDHHGSASMLGMWGADVKYFRPVAKHVEVYLRGGLSTGWATAVDGTGRGIGIGAGAQLKGKVPVIGFLFWPLFFSGVGPKVSASVYVDTGLEYYRFHSVRGSTDAQLDHLTIGFAVGSDL